MADYVTETRQTGSRMAERRVSIECGVIAFSQVAGDRRRIAPRETNDFHALLVPSLIMRESRDQAHDC